MRKTIADLLFSAAWGFLCYHMISRDGWFLPLLGYVMGFVLLCMLFDGYGMNNKSKAPKIKVEVNGRG